VAKGRRGQSPGPAAHDNHLQREVTAAAPNRTWVSDVPEPPTVGGNAPQERG